jgi:hypothetical protein
MYFAIANPENHFYFVCNPKECRRGKHMNTRKEFIAAT